MQTNTRTEGRRKEEWEGGGRGAATQTARRTKEYHSAVMMYVTAFGASELPELKILCALVLMR